jgi:putative peptide zinc metalloprotease protein
VNLYKFFKVPGSLAKVVRWRMYTTLGLIAVALAGVLMLPLPSHVFCNLVVQPRGAASVYVEHEGILEKVLVKVGDHVEMGQPLAQLSNIDIDISIADLTGQRDVYKVQLEGLMRMSFDDQTASAQVSEVTESLKSVTQQLAQRVEDRQKMQLVAPRAGTVLPPAIVQEQTQGDAQLPTWSGYPFDPENLGATLQTGTKLCQIGDPHRVEARLVIDQGDVPFVAPGQKVEILLDQSAGTAYEGTIENVSSENLKTSPQNLSSLHGGKLATQMDSSGMPRPLSPVYEAVVPLPEDEQGLLRAGLTGQAKITTAPRTLGSRLWRYFSHTFNFEL